MDVEALLRCKIRIPVEADGGSACRFTEKYNVDETFQSI